MKKKDNVAKDNMISKAEELQKNIETEAPKISIVIPCYNVEKYLEETLKSVLEQTLEEIEIICVNDGSKDGTVDVMNKYAQIDERVIVIDKINEGYGKAVNSGMKVAKGEYVGIVESDDFITEDMYETLYELSYEGTVDLVKGNFWDYYDFAGQTPEAVTNQERQNMPEVKEPFNIRQHRELLWGHPSVWSGIYRRAFLQENKIEFIEAKGGGWVDNPFFFETVSKAKTIMWTATPLYYYRKTNPNSSSNAQGDPTLPFVRMMDNLDVLESNGMTDVATERYAYARAIMYMTGAFEECDYGSNYDVINEYAKNLMRRLDSDVISTDFNITDQYKYFAYASPMKTIDVNSPKILIYNWLPFDNKHNWGGGVNLYSRNIISALLKEYPSASIYFLSSGFAYAADKDKTFIRKIDNVFGERVHQYEIVNSPIPAAQDNMFVNPTVACENENLKKVFGEFLDEKGPFKAIHFQNIEGLSMDILDLKEEYPNTKFVFSLHNYIPFCVTGFYYQRHNHCNCIPEHTGTDCFACTRVGLKRNIATAMYHRGIENVNPSEAISEARFIKKLNLERLDRDASPEDMILFENTAKEKLNKNCDHILAVSQRVYDIAASNGIDENKMVVSYIGTAVAKHQMAQMRNEIGDELKIVFLGNDINYEEKGYPFLLDALEQLEDEFASKIDIVLTVRNPEHAEIYTMLKRFRSIKVIQGYTHEDLDNIFEGCNLSIVPVLWEDNLPQIAIESVAYGVPVLASSAGGASELTNSELFRFEAGNAEDLRAKIIHFIKKPEDLYEYWTHHSGLVTMKQHCAELQNYYNLSDIEEALVLSPEDYSYLRMEYKFLHENVSLNDDKFVPNPVVEELKRRLWEAENRVRELTEEKERMEYMDSLKGKVIFFVECTDKQEQAGANLFKLTVEDFDYSDFYAEIKFIRLENVKASKSDTLFISGTWHNEEGEYELHIHQSEWERGVPEITEYIKFYVRDNTIYFFAKYPSRYSGFVYDIETLTSRHESNTTVQFEQINQGHIMRNENAPKGL